MPIAVRLEGRVAVVDLEGKLTLGDGKDLLRAEIDRLLAGGRTQVLLNLARVPYMDSAGIGELTATYTKVTAAGGAVKLLNPERRVFDILQRVKLDSIFEVHVDEPAALASFGAAD